jgi:hypothetical protein
LAAARIRSLPDLFSTDVSVYTRWRLATIKKKNSLMGAAKSTGSSIKYNSSIR